MDPAPPRRWRRSRRLTWRARQGLISSALGTVRDVTATTSSDPIDRSPDDRRVVRFWPATTR
jgi:hypothetical protein